MFNRVGLLLVLALTLSVHPAHAQQRVVLPESAFRAAGLERRWVTVLPVGGLQDRVRAAAVVEDLFVVQTKQRATHVVDVETGRLLYSVEGQATVQGKPAVAVNGEAVFTFKGPNLMRYNRNTGVLEWRIYLDQSPWSPLVANAEYVYFGTVQGRLYAIPTQRNVPGIQKWFAQLYAPVDAAPLAHLQWVVVGSTDGLVYVFPTRSRNVVFRYRVNDEVIVPAVAYQNNLFVASRDGYVYSVDIRTGETFWRYPVGDGVSEPMLLATNGAQQYQLFVVSESRILYCMDPLTGEELWNVPNVNRLVAASKTRLYVEGPTRDLRILSRSDGSAVALLPTHGIEFVVFNSYSDRILLVSASGVAVMASEPGAEKPTYHRPLSRPEAVGEANPPSEQ